MTTNKTARENGHPGSRGDTILSVMLSVVIIGSVIGATYYAINRSLNLGRASQERGHALNVANIQLERLKALLDTQPSVIFDDDKGINEFKTSGGSGFGDKFCLILDESVGGALRFSLNADLTIPRKAATNPDTEVHEHCRTANLIHFPVANAEPRVEIRYQERHATKNGDRNRFEIAVYWTRIGSDEEEELKIHYRSHPLIFGP